jgi:hypothetical protein
MASQNPAFGTSRARVVASASASASGVTHHSGVTPDREFGVTTEESPPPSEIQLRNQIALAATAIGSTGSIRAELHAKLERYQSARELLVHYPGAQRLPGGSDDKIIQDCLRLARDDTDRLFAALKEMHKAGKQPNSAWAWFPTVLKQYLPRDGAP